MVREAIPSISTAVSDAVPDCKKLSSQAYLVGSSHDLLALQPAVGPAGRLAFIWSHVFHIFRSRLRLRAKLAVDGSYAIPRYFFFKLFDIFSFHFQE